MTDPLTAILYSLLVFGLAMVFLWPEHGLLALWQQRQRKSNRVLGEDALKHIYLNAEQGESVSLQDLIGRLQISGQRGEQLVQILQEKELVLFEGETLRLTPGGRRYALQVVRAHRLWEHYLSRESGFSEAEWHERAEDYEHRLTAEAANALSDYLGHPTHDPHGDPIPTRTGQLVRRKGVLLSTVEPGTTGRIIHIEDEPPCVYAQLVAEGLYPGMQVEIIERDSKRIRFWADEEDHVLAPLLAANVSIVPVKKEEVAAGKQPVEAGLSLAVLKPGQKGEVVAISPLSRGAERRRMLDLGIVPGTIIEAAMKSPLGEPTAYRVRGALIAFRSEQAERIRIRPVADASPARAETIQSSTGGGQS